MADLVRVDLFVEDRAQEAFVGALVRRVLREAGQGVTVRSRSALGGHGRALTELEAFQKAVRGQQPGLNVPDVLIIARDANCSAFSEAHKEIVERIDPNVFPTVAIACPDPHVERWFLADPISFRAVVGADPRPGPRKCTRDLYKRRLAEAVREGGNPATLGGIEFASDLVEAMDLFRAGKNEPSLRHFIDDIRKAATLVER